MTNIDENVAIRFIDYVAESIAEDIKDEDHYDPQNITIQFVNHYLTNRDIPQQLTDLIQDGESPYGDNYDDFLKFIIDNNYYYNHILHKVYTYNY